MQELKIDKARVLSAADKCSSAKEVLKYLFPEVFKKDWRDIKTFEDACDVLGFKTNAIFHGNDSQDEIAFKKLKVIVKAINMGWTPDWDNDNQRKWYPWFILSSGFGFGASGYDSAYSSTSCGSRLCTDTREKALYIAEQFKAEYQDYFLYSE